MSALLRLVTVLQRCQETIRHKEAVELAAQKLNARSRMQTHALIHRRLAATRSHPPRAVTHKAQAPVKAHERREKIWDRKEMEGWG